MSAAGLLPLQSLSTLDAIARDICRSICSAPLLQLSPYALHPLLDTKPLPEGTLSASLLHCSNYKSTAANGAGTSNAGAIAAGGGHELASHEDRGLVTIVASDRPGLQASMLSACLPAVLPSRSNKRQGQCCLQADKQRAYVC